MKTSGNNPVFRRVPFALCPLSRPAAFSCCCCCCRCR